MIRLFCLLIFLPSSIYAAEYLPCYFSATKNISFRNEYAEDVLKISLEGKSCEAAKLTYSIYTIEGKILYKSTQPELTNFTTYGNDSSHNNILNYFKWSLKWPLKDTSMLPKRVICNKNDDKYCNEFPEDENHTESPLSLKEYESLKRKRIPMFTHRTGSESWKSIIFEQKSSIVVEVLSGGV